MRQLYCGSQSYDFPDSLPLDQKNPFETWLTVAIDGETRRVIVGQFSSDA
jgi:hypothetical protein